MLRPTLIVALGGTGTNVSLRLRTLFELRYGTPDPEGVRFLFIDTDTIENPVLSANSFPGRCFPLSVGAQTIQDLQKRDSEGYKRLKINEWFDRKLLENLTNQNFSKGVGGVRMYGRLSLLAANQLYLLMGQLESDIQGMVSIQNSGMPRPVQVIVVASAGGGTGSGTFIDMGYLTKIAADKVGNENIPCQREGILAVAVPTLVKSPNHARNSAAMLSELDYFSETRNVFEANYAGTNLEESAGREAPYDYAYLVSPTLDAQVLNNDPKLAISKLEQKIANYLFVRTTEADARRPGAQLSMGEAGSRLADMAQNWLQMPQGDQQGYSLRFLTFGVSLRLFPVGLCAKLGYRKAASNFVKSWFKEKEPGRFTLNAVWLQKQHKLDMLYKANLTELREILGLRPEEEHNKTRDSKKDKLYDMLIQIQQNETGLEVALVESAHNGRLHEMFDYSGGNVRPRPGGSGYIAGILNLNTRMLLAEHDADSLPNRLRAWFWKAAFDVERGPRYVLSLLQVVDTEIQAEMTLMNEAMKEFGKGGSAAVSGGINREQAVRGDKLLLLWKERAAERERGFDSPDVAAAANRKYEECVLKARCSVYAGVRDQLFIDDAPQGYHLPKRLENMIAYVEAWLMQIQEDDTHQRELLANLSEEVVYSDAILEQKMQTLAPVILPDTLHELRQQVNTNTFDKALPRGADQSLNLKPFKSLEDALRAAMQSTEQGTDSLYGDSVIRLMTSPDSEEAIKKQAEAMILESRPLLNLNLSATGYGNMLGANPPVFQHATYFWGLAAQNTLDPPSYKVFWEEAEKQGRAISNPLGAANATPQELRSEDGSVAACIFMRNAFPTRIINGYSPDERSLRVNPTQVTADTVSTPHIDIRIRTPIPQARIEEAEKLLLLAEIFLKQKGERDEYPWLVVGSVAHTLHYTRLDRKVGDLELQKTGFNNMIYQLALDPLAVEALRREFNRRKLLTSQHGAYATTFIMHIKNLNTLLPQLHGRYAQLDLKEVDYNRAFDLLVDGAELLGVDLDPAHDPTLIDWAAQNEEGYWICKRCQNNMGSETPSLRGQCDDCGNPRT